MAEISEKSFPFDTDQDKMGNYDREYHADDFAEYFRAFISSGVFMDDESSLRVDANGDMTVNLNPGRLIGEGYRYTNKNNITITIDPADGVLDRIDRIAIVWSKSARNMHYEYHIGEPSYDPAAPECRRTKEYMDYVVADIHVTAGIISITQNDIEDQRLNPQVCGLATPFMHLDTTLIFHQLQGFYEKVLAEHTDWEAAKKSEVEVWFNTMKGQLTADAAVNLQNQIFDLAAKSFTLTNNLLATVPGKSALDAAVGPVIQEQIDEVRADLGGNIITYENGKFYIQAGADAASKKQLGNGGNFTMILNCSVASATANSSWEGVVTFNLIITCTNGVLSYDRSIKNSTSLNTYGAWRFGQFKVNSVSITWN